MKARWPLAGVLGLASLTLFATSAPATPPAPGVTTTILAKSAVAPLDIRARNLNPATDPASVWRAHLKTRGVSDAYVVDNKFLPGSDTGWHSHPGPSLIFVVAGTVTNYDSDARGCRPRVYATGDSFVDSGGKDSHLLRNEGAVAAETIAVQIVPTGATRRIDEPIPAKCKR
jgi:quercetin dioxygenase-like cupin family protein